MDQQIKELQKQIDDLKKDFDSLNSSTTIPYNVAVAIKARLEQDFTQAGAGVVTPPAYTQAVNEGGSATYNVAKPMAGFISITFGGITYNIPYY